MFGVILVIFLCNIALALGKIIIGISIQALSMISDGLHSGLDAVSNIMGLAGIKISEKPPDFDHPYGHQKFEVFAAMAISVFMGVTCFEIILNIIHRLKHPQIMPKPTLMALGIMIISMGLNLMMSWYERKKGNQYNSQYLWADSAHVGTDFLASVSVLVALIISKLHWGNIDVIVSGWIVIIILRSAYQIVTQSLQILSDHSVLDPASVASLVTNIPGIISCHKVRSRGMPGNIFIDLHIQVPAQLTVKRSHQLAHQVVAVIKEKIAGVNEVWVHTEPAKQSDYVNRQKISKIKRTSKTV